MRILAHRGSPTPSTTENTVQAVTAALLAGADGVEVDLRLSADGVLVVCHDPDLRRVAGSPLPVAQAPWPVLRAAADGAGVPLARAEEVLGAAAGAGVVLELKAPPPAPRARARTAEALVDRLCSLRTIGLAADVTVSSFDASLVKLVRAELPVDVPVRTALLGRPGWRVSALLRQALAAGHDEVHPHVLDVLAAPKAVAAAHALGLAVVPWTVNARRALRRCGDLGVDAVITDVPVTARALQVRSTAA